MNTIFLMFIGGLLGALVLGVVLAFRKEALPLWARVVGVVLLLAPIPFSLFGFAATFEPGDDHWVWRIGYAVILLVCLGGIIRLCWPLSRAPSE